MFHRLHPPIDPQKQTFTINGRTYSSTPGTPLNVPDFDAAVLEANGWIFIAPADVRANRPTSTIGQYVAVPGADFYDLTNNVLTTFDGATWRDTAGNAVA